MSIPATTNATPAASFSLDDMLRAAADFAALCKAHRKQDLRRSAEIAEMKCNVCGRKATVTGSFPQGTVVVCRHMWDGLQRLPRAVGPVRSPSLLGGVRFELFDDGPARF